MSDLDYWTGSLGRVMAVVRKSDGCYKKRAKGHSQTGRLRDGLSFYSARESL